MHEQMLQLRCAAMQSDSSEAPNEKSHQLMLPKYAIFRMRQFRGALIQQIQQVVSANSDHLEYYKDLSGAQFLAIF